MLKWELSRIPQATEYREEKERNSVVENLGKHTHKFTHTFLKIF